MGRRHRHAPRAGRRRDRGDEPAARATCPTGGGDRRSTGAASPKGCGVYAGGSAILAGNDFNYRTPDLIVSCVASREHWVERPRLVIEILSNSTQKHDTTGKLAFYRSIASVDEILLVRFDQRWCELWQRVGGNWSIEDHIGSAILPLRITTEPLPLDEIYGPLDL
jgi:Uma2 family endonuclease